MQPTQRFLIKPKSSAVLTMGMQPPPGYVSFKMVDAWVLEHGRLGFVELSHPLFEMGSFKHAVHASYRIDFDAWFGGVADKSELLIIAFRKIIEKNHGKFRTCGHKEEKGKIESTKLDIEECMRHIQIDMGHISLREE